VFNEGLILPVERCVGGSDCRMRLRGDSSLSAYLVGSELANLGYLGRPKHCACELNIVLAAKVGRLDVLKDVQESFGFHTLRSDIPREGRDAR
jgi:hypothetical protein